MQMLVTGFGYAIAVIGMLSMASISVGHLLLGGAIVGVVLGIAAQQSLGNVFAGLVLLVARPFAVGNYIRVRSGSLGGEFFGTVTSMSLTYVSIMTDQGMLKVPNSSLLSAAVGQRGDRTPRPGAARPTRHGLRLRPPARQRRAGRGQAGRQLRGRRSRQRGGGS